MTALTAEQRRAVEDLVAASDFAMFECIDLDEMLELHETTPQSTAWTKCPTYTTACLYGRRRLPSKR
ncbi:hypothetical protein [Streptomyces sp. NEAU-YJ-81]|uniref:hypothetical protein n=1 Tax=Streptomyces sp. NEAU-YJ-81 TaxID=2820288 RepID=UPI001ABC1209|nr:hypothetical protein [Streptomyces sp. NEAU-YJ-81]MBO3678702.1 hypothetical protein [Streptomyces sp. NEAU-YJ-81]